MSRQGRIGCCSWCCLLFIPSKRKDGKRGSHIHKDCKLHSHILHSRNTRGRRWPQRWVQTQRGRPHRQISCRSSHNHKVYHSSHHSNLCILHIHSSHTRGQRRPRHWDQTRRSHQQISCRSSRNIRKVWRSHHSNLCIHHSRSSHTRGQRQHRR